MLSRTFPPNSTMLLHRWRVLEAVSPGNIRTRHICGQDDAGSVGISTSAIQEFDPVGMSVNTRSGRTYILFGPSGESRLGEGAWRKWCNDNGIVAELDVTGEYLKAEQASTVTFKKISFRYEESTAF